MLNICTGWMIQQHSYKGSSANHKVSWEETNQNHYHSLSRFLKKCSFTRYVPLGDLDFFTLKFYELIDLGDVFHSRPNLMVNEELLYLRGVRTVFLWERGNWRVLIQLGWDGPRENILQEPWGVSEWVGVRQVKEMRAGCSGGRSSCTRTRHERNCRWVSRLGMEARRAGIFPASGG